MPLRDEAKREYQRHYMRRRHGFLPRGVREGGEVGKRDTKGDLDPTLDPPKKGDFRPIGSLDPFFGGRRGNKGAERLLEYMQYLNERGRTMETFTHPQDGRVAYRSQAIGMVGELQVQALQLQQRVTLLEAELAAFWAELPWERAEAILDDQRRELREEELSWGSGGQHEG